MKVVINGRVVEADALLASAPKRKAASRAATGPVAEHKGFRVVGHYKDQCAGAQNLNASEWKAWNSHTAEQRAQAIRDHKRPPPMWDEAQWRLRTRKSYVRSRPYEVLAAAEECKALAELDGWEDVEVLALVKGDAPPPGMF